MNGTSLPLIFDIRHFSLDDGPGIRTTVFLKGCPLSCSWCHNPESMATEKEIAFYRHRCINCGDCETTCPENAINLKEDVRVVRNRCTACGLCVEICPTKALKSIGLYYPQEKLTRILLGDKIFYDTSRGGITFSGGEPTLFMDYVSPVMKALKEHNIHIAVQTSGMFEFSEFESKILPYIDLIFYDVKLMDPEKHKTFTGKTNNTILSNLTLLAKLATVDIVPRVPLIPGITDTSGNLEQIGVFLQTIGFKTYECLSYNSGGNEKRMALGQSFPGVPFDSGLLPDYDVDDAQTNIAEKTKL